MNWWSIAEGLSYSNEWVASKASASSFSRAHAILSTKVLAEGLIFFYTKLTLAGIFSLAGLFSPPFDLSKLRIANAQGRGLRVACA